MKPAPFEYFAPTTVDEALANLAEYGYEAKVLAGGQSLIPMMNFRLAQPSIIVDINKITDLFYIRENEEGGLRIGAMARHNQVEHNPLVAARAALIADAMPQIATVQVRSRGTFGGSLAHADPSAELAAVSVAFDGSFLLRNQRGERWIRRMNFSSASSPLCLNQMNCCSKQIFRRYLNARGAPWLSWLAGLTISPWLELQPW
jgi:carbon-monoxide dehydrogenase medium subunit